MLKVIVRYSGHRDKVSDSIQVDTVQKTNKQLTLPYHWWRPLLLMLGKVGEVVFFVKVNILVMSVIGVRSFLIGNRNCQVKADVSYVLR